MATIEGLLIKRYVTTTTFENMVKGVTDSSRFRGWVMVNMVYIMMFIRSFIVCIMTKMNYSSTEGLMGNYLQILGINGFVLHIWIVGYSVTLIILRLIYRHYERRRNLDFVTDFRPLMSHETVYRMKLPEKNLKVLRYISKLSCFFVPAIGAIRVANGKYYGRHLNHHVSRAASIPLLF